MKKEFHSSLIKGKLQFAENWSLFIVKVRLNVNRAKYKNNWSFKKELLQTKLLPLTI